MRGKDRRLNNISQYQNEVLQKLYPNFLDHLFYNFYIDVDNFLNNYCLYQKEIEFSN